MVDLVDVRIPARASKVVPLIREARFEIMCPRHVRRAEAGIVFGDKPSGITAGPHVVAAIRTVHGIERQIRDPDVIRSHVRLSPGVLI